MDENLRIALFFAHEFIDPTVHEFAAKLNQAGWLVMESGRVVKENLRGIPCRDSGDQPGDRDLTISDVVCLGLTWPVVVDGAVQVGSRSNMTVADRAAKDIDPGLALILRALVANCIVVVHPNDYRPVLDWIISGEPNPEKFRAKLAVTALEMVRRACVALGKEFSEIAK